MPTLDDPVAAQVAAIRRFNRFYTRQVGALNEALLESGLALPEARLVYELAQGEALVASELGRELGLDPGYLSRLLRGLEDRGLIQRSPSPSDGRQSLIALTPAGRELFKVIDGRSRAEIAALLEPLAPDARARLVGAMASIERLIGAPAPGTPAFVIRNHQPGDMGWVVHRHAVLYAQEYGWDAAFEAMAARIAARFLEKFDASRERCWIAERDGEIVGSVVLVQKSKRVGQLRMLYVEPSTRGLGLGRRLVAECLRFARQVGYRKVMLWTNDILVAARHIYEAEGFVLLAEERHHSFGHDLVGQTWELTLQ